MPDSIASEFVLLPPLLLRLVYRQQKLGTVAVRSLQQWAEGWEDRELSDVGLFMLRLQLTREVFEVETRNLEDLCPGLAFLGNVVVPTNDYVIHGISKQLRALGFRVECLERAGTGRIWAFLGPGNWGPDGWLVLFGVDGNVVVIFVLSKLRSTITQRYPKGALAVEAGKCWKVDGVDLVLLFLTDERGHGNDNEVLDGGGMPVVPVSRNARLATYGVAIAAIKRLREVVRAGKPAKKPKI